VISLRTGGPLTVSQAINAGTGEVQLLTTGNIADITQSGCGTITGSFLRASTAGNITLSQSNNVAAGQLVAGGNISYTAAGNVAVQFVDTTGNAALNAPNGSIFNGPINAGPNGITAGQLQLSAGVGIGTAGSPLLTNVKSVEASAG